MNNALPAPVSCALENFASPTALSQIRINYLDKEGVFFGGGKKVGSLHALYAK